MMIDTISTCVAPPTNPLNGFLRPATLNVRNLEMMYGRTKLGETACRSQVRVQEYAHPYTRGSSGLPHLRKTRTTRPTVAE